MENSANLIQVNAFDGKYLINESYRPIARALIEKYPELRHILVNSILFVEDTVSTKKKNGKVVFAQIGPIPEKWNDILFQMTGRSFDFMLEVFKVNTSVMSREQIIALIYHELRHIDLDGKIIGHDIEDWLNMVEKLGIRWGSTRANIPDILEDGVDWDSITGPPSLFPNEFKLSVVK